MAIDVTDASFATAVMEQSHRTPVVVDLWAPWCGPCKTLGPILDKVIAATDGKVTLAKVNVDENPQVSAAFKVQSIPAVYALVDGKVVGSFVGAKGEAEVRAFVEGLLPTQEESAVDALVSAGDEASLRQALELDHGHEGAVVALAELLVGKDARDEALALLERIPESAATRRIAALARTADVLAGADIETKLAELLGSVRDDEVRQEFVDLLEVMGPDDPRTAEWRRKLTAALY
jgi:putative thioredoxin